MQEKEEISYMRACLAAAMCLAGVAVCYVLIAMWIYCADDPVLSNLLISIILVNTVSFILLAFLGANKCDEDANIGVIGISNREKLRKIYAVYLVSIWAPIICFATTIFAFSLGKIAAGIEAVLAWIIVEITKRYLIAYINKIENIEEEN